MSTAEKKAKILQYIKKHLKHIDPDGSNYTRYEAMFNGMTDTKFHAFMKTMQAGEWQFHIIVPNMGAKASQDDILAAAKSVGVELFQRVWLTDGATGQKYLTRSKHPILQVPVRRMQQFLDKKLSVPDNDSTIDGLSGQVTGDSKAASISAPEIQALHARGLTKVLDELVTVRGGDIANYGEAKRQMEEQGSVSLGTLDGSSISRTAKVTQILLEGMHLSSNLVEEG